MFYTNDVYQEKTGSLVLVFYIDISFMSPHVQWLALLMISYDKNMDN